MALKQHFGKKILELEEEKRTVQVSQSETSYHIICIGPLYFLFPVFDNFNKCSGCSVRGITCWQKLKTFLLILTDMHKNCEMHMPRN